jgi:transcriptional regulator with XRE-family HTH domain
VSDPARHVQRLLTGMPAQRPPLSVQADARGRQIVVADRAVVLFGPFEATDLGARNLAIVSLTQMGFGVGQTAEAFGLRPGTVSELRTAFHREGAAGVVKVSGRRAKLDQATLTEIRALRAQGWSQAQIAAKYQVTQPAISQALARRAPTGPAGQPTDQQAAADQQPTDASHGDGSDLQPAGIDLDQQDGDQQDGDQQDEESSRSWGEGAAFGLAAASGAGPRIGQGVFECRYAGAMLGYAYTDRAGIGPIWAGLGGAPWRRFDQTQIATFTLLALLLGVGSVEKIKTLIRAQAGPLIASPLSPGLEVLRGRLAAIADAGDIPALQTQVATAMLAMPGQAGGVFYVDDHFVPYTGARPVAMGHNGKRDRCEPGRADTLITDARGRAVCFSSADPSHLSKTMKPALAQLRAIVPAGKILLGFDRGGAYAEAFTACREHDIDFVTYRRGTLAPTTAAPITHQVTRGRKKIAVRLAEEQIVFSDDYTGPCRQLSLYEPGPDCTCPTSPTSDPADRPGAAPAGCPHLRLVITVAVSL